MWFVKAEGVFCRLQSLACAEAGLNITIVVCVSFYKRFKFSLPSMQAAPSAAQTFVILSFEGTRMAWLTFCFVQPRLQSAPALKLCRNLDRNPPCQRAGCDVEVPCLSRCLRVKKGLAYLTRSCAQNAGSQHWGDQIVLKTHEK